MITDLVKALKVCGVSLDGLPIAKVEEIANLCVNVRMEMEAKGLESLPQDPNKEMLMQSLDVAFEKFNELCDRVSENGLFSTEIDGPEYCVVSATTKEVEIQTENKIYTIGYQIVPTHMNIEDTEE